MILSDIKQNNDFKNVTENRLLKYISPPQSGVKEEINAAIQLVEKSLDDLNARVQKIDSRLSEHLESMECIYTGTTLFSAGPSTSGVRMTTEAAEAGMEAFGAIERELDETRREVDGMKRYYDEAFKEMASQMGHGRTTREVSQMVEATVKARVGAVTRVYDQKLSVLLVQVEEATEVLHETAVQQRAPVNSPCGLCTPLGSAAKGRQNEGTAWQPQFEKMLKEMDARLAQVLRECGELKQQEEKYLERISWLEDRLISVEQSTAGLFNSPDSGRVDGGNRVTAETGESRGGNCGDSGSIIFHGPEAGSAESSVLPVGAEASVFGKESPGYTSVEEEGFRCVETDGDHGCEKPASAAEKQEQRRELGRRFQPRAMWECEVEPRAGYLGTMEEDDDDDEREDDDESDEDYYDDYNEESWLRSDASSELQDLGTSICADQPRAEEIVEFFGGRLATDERGNLFEEALASGGGAEEPQERVDRLEETLDHEVTRYLNLYHGAGTVSEAQRGRRRRRRLDEQGSESEQSPISERMDRLESRVTEMEGVVRGAARELEDMFEELEKRGETFTTWPNKQGKKREEEGVGSLRGLTSNVGWEFGGSFRRVSSEEW